MPVVFQQNMKFRNQPEEVIQEFDFVGGLVKDAHETKLKPNQSPNMINVIPNDTGSIKSRGGYTAYNETPQGSASDEANTGASTGTRSLAAITDEVAQTFQVGTGADMVQVSLWLAMANADESQQIQVELWSGDTGPDELILAGPIMTVDDTSETQYRFTFRLPSTLTSATEYAIVAKPYVRSSQQTIYEVLVHHTGAAYANGAAYESDDGGVTWAAVASTDLKFDIYTGGSTGCTGLLRFYGASGLQQQLAKFGDTLYVGNDNTGALTAQTPPDALDSAAYIDYTISNDTLLVVDGSNRILKYRGSDNADYSTGTISVTTGSSTVTGSGTNWDPMLEAGMYIKLPDTKWYLITGVSSDTSLTIEISYAGATATGQTYEASAWGNVQGDLNSSSAPSLLVRPTPDYIENHINRIWALKNNTLYFSALDTSIEGEHFNDWDTAGNAGQIIIPSGNGDSGTGLYSLNNTLYIFQRRAIWGLYGNSPANFELRNITNEIGMIDKRSLVEWGEILTFLSDRGIILFDGSNVRNISDGVINSLIDTWANKTSPTAILWENKYVLSYTESGASGNNKAIYYDYTRGIFGELDEVPAGVWATWEGGTDDGEIYFGSSRQGSIYRWDVGGNDAGHEIQTLYDTPSLGFGAGINDKAVKKFYIQQIAKGDWDMDITQFSDISADEINSSINLSPGSQALWDVAQWDEDEWSDEGTIITNRVAEFQGLAKYYKFRFEETGYDTGVEILGMTVTARKRRLL